jgi:long-subunit fatty acid transport protein
LALAVYFAARPAGADPLELFGFGARQAALAGATTADAQGAAAAHQNPAAIADVERAEVVLGWGYGGFRLELDGQDAGVLDAHGADLGIALPIGRGRVRHGFGVALHLPDQFIARIQLIPASDAHYVLLDNDPHRIVIEPVYAFGIGPLAIGAGVSLLADAAGNGITFDVGVRGGEKVGESALDVALPTRAAPLVGVRYTPSRRVRLGASWRGELGLGLKLDILANVDVAGVVSGDALIALRALNYYTPERLSAGVAVALTPTLRASGEVTWQRWSEFEGGVPDLKVLVALGVSPPLVSTLFPEDRFHDTVTPRLGLEWQDELGPIDLAVRTGYAYVPSPVPAQTGLTSFADGDRHVLGLGAGVTLRAFAPILTRPIGFDVGLQWHHLRARLTIKDQTMFPGRTFSSSGDIVRGVATMTVQF